MKFTILEEGRTEIEAESAQAAIDKFLTEPSIGRNIITVLDSKGKEVEVNFDESLL